MNKLEKHIYLHRPARSRIWGFFYPSFWRRVCRLLRYHLLIEGLSHPVTKK